MSSAFQQVIQIYNGLYIYKSLLQFFQSMYNSFNFSKQIITLFFLYIQFQIFIQPLNQTKKQDSSVPITFKIYKNRQNYSKSIMYLLFITYKTPTTYFSTPCKNRLDFCILTMLPNTCHNGFYLMFHEFMTTVD